MNMAVEEVTPRTNPNETKRSMDATPMSLPPKLDAARVGFFVSFMAMAWLQASMREGETLCPGHALAALYNGCYSIGYCLVEGIGIHARRRWLCFRCKLTWLVRAKATSVLRARPDSLHELLVGCKQSMGRTVVVSSFALLPL